MYVHWPAPKLAREKNEYGKVNSSCYQRASLNYEARLRSTEFGFAALLADMLKKLIILLCIRRLWLSVFEYQSHKFKMKIQNGDRFFPIVFPFYCTVLVCPASLETLLQSLLKAKSTNSRKVKVLMPRSRPKYPPIVAKRKKKVKSFLSLKFVQPASQPTLLSASRQPSIN